MKLAIGAAAAAVLLTVIATPSAEALPPTTRTIKDKVEPGKAYDIVEVTMRSAPKSNRPAVIVVTHGRAVTFGDALDGDGLRKVRPQLSSKLGIRDDQRLLIDLLSPVDATHVVGENFVDAELAEIGVHRVREPSPAPFGLAHGAPP